MTEGVRRLYRSPQDRMLFGVCGGLGEYLMLDPTVVRLILIAIGLMAGPGILLAYLLLALIVPETPAE